MKMNLCDKFLFRAKKANVACTKESGHEGKCVFPIPEADAHPVVIRSEDATQRQQGVVKG